MSQYLDYDATLDCVHCGLCLPHCPTYQETGRETSSPRGRIYLMRGVAEGSLELDAQVVGEMYFCLACRACESACPSGVRYGALVEGMRAEIDARGARSIVTRTTQRFTFRHLLPSRRLMMLLGTFLRFYQNSGMQAALRRSNVLRVAGRLAEAEAMLPKLSPAYRPPVQVPAKGRRRGRVALFSGCLMPEFFPSVNRATIEVLIQNGFEVEIPAQQTCCGALHLHSGDPDGAARLLRRNRQAFRIDDVDAIIMNSAGCGAALKDSGDRLAEKIRDISEFLYEAEWVKPTEPVPMRVAYDDPCHLLHAQKIHEAPRALLRSIPELELVDLPGASDCCGAAGIYSFTQPEMSKTLLDRKLRALQEIAPDAVATGNPGCLLQLGAGVRKAGLRIDVVHPVELLARAYL